MILREIIIKILDNYLPVKELTKEQKQELKYNIQVELKEEVEKLISSKTYTIKGRTAVGRWADVPWLGIHSKKINSAAQSGIYVTILFCVDGNGFAFSIQQGTEKFNPKEIKKRASQTREDFFISDSRFVKSDIDIRGENSNISNNSRPAKYEIANIIGRRYKRDNIPMNLEDDLMALIHIYEIWINNLVYKNNLESLEYINTNLNLDKSSSSKPVERLESREVRTGYLYPPLDIKQGSLALINANYKCEINSTHETFINSNDVIYMEKHHLIPMNKYFEFKLSIDHSFNIYSLCPTCHRQIHYGKPEDKKKMISYLFNIRKDLYKEYYNIENDTEIYKYYHL